MPGLLIQREPSPAGSSSASSSGSSQRFDYSRHGSVVGDSDYAASSFPQNEELPLSEQLEPIAVVGMGKQYPVRVPNAEMAYK